MGLASRDFEELLRELFNKPKGFTSSSQAYIFNINATDANTAYSQILPDHVKQFQIRVRGGQAKLRLAFAETELNSNYVTIERGCRFDQSGLDPLSSSLTLWVQSDLPGQVIEILAWT